ncbi:hypothetical protein AXG93_2947s1030 [Marchantia polymorpha subsp. ruderalis]|uniref:Uncharacterized protein n=1 Tax=Marchantia polymorpha subsp. ruderalis TaxID=1480154 RepID=A0A176WSB4_MARPO|nr:hypothetical protein AXG93_2947s1030 [Marchantia polymorpha subsp. ruderalis]
MMHKRKSKQKEAEKEEGSLRRNPGPSAEAVVSTPLEKNLEVLTMSSETEEYPAPLEQLVDRVVDDVARDIMYVDGKLEKYAGPFDVGSYVELVRNRTRVMVAAATLTAEQVESLSAERATAKASLEEKEKQLQESKAKVDELTADLVKRDQAHVAELAAKVKELPECEAARSSELELLERLNANCNEMRSQRSEIKEQLDEMETKQLKVKERNRQLAE